MVENDLLEPFDDHYFTGGWVEVGRDNSFQIQPILDSRRLESNRFEFSLAQQFVNVPQRTLVRLYPGCDGQASTCKAKFNNFVNFGGFVDVPEVNPFVKAVETGPKAPSVGKK